MACHSEENTELRLVTKMKAHTRPEIVSPRTGIRDGQTSARPSRPNLLVSSLGWGLSVWLASLLVAQAAPLWVSGITEPVTDATMSSPVIGILATRFFEEGAFVKKGQVLAELDKRIEELEVARRKLVHGLAKRELERITTLSERNTISVSREELEKKQAEFNVAGVELELAQEQLRRRQLLAPFDGCITEFYLEVGEGCEVQQPVLRLVDTRRCYFVTNIEARAGHELKVGQNVKLEIEIGGKAQSLEGTVHFISPVVDAASGLLKIKLIFDNSQNLIRPGVGGRMLLKEA